MSLQKLYMLALVSNFDTDLSKQWLDINVYKKHILSPIVCMRIGLDNGFLGLAQGRFTLSLCYIGCNADSNIPCPVISGPGIDMRNITVGQKYSDFGLDGHLISLENDYGRDMQWQLKVIFQICEMTFMIPFMNSLTKNGNKTNTLFESRIKCFSFVNLSMKQLSQPTANKNSCAFSLSLADSIATSTTWFWSI